jgi:DNA (cytosine-5)-methyltransferase 1
MTTTQPAAISLFSGAGGMDLGITQAGFRILLSIDSDPNCCETLRSWAERDLTGSVVVQDDIRILDPTAILKQLDLRPGGLDLLAGGPPCQAFSQIGKQESLDDERGMLLFEMIRFAEAFRPRAILVEQVKGLLNARDRIGTKGGVFASFLAKLRHLGYVPKWQVLNAADYGVAQVRKRVFIVAMPPPNGFAFPAPSHADLQRTPLLPAYPYVTVGQALQGLAAPAAKTEANGIPNDGHVDVTPVGDRTRIRDVPEGGHLAAQHHLSSDLRRNLTKKDTTKFRRLARNEPSLTLRCGEIFFHPAESRYLTPREYMRLHGFPDDYELRGPVRGRSGRVRHLDQHRQVANSVPPPVARAIAVAIRNTLCRNGTESERGALAAAGAR